MSAIKRVGRAGGLVLAAGALWCAGCGGSGTPAQSSSAVGDPGVVIFGGTITTDAKQTIDIANTGRTLTVVHTGETMHITAQLDPSATRPYATMGNVTPGSGAPVTWSPMNAVPGQAGEWSLNWTFSKDSQHPIGPVSQLYAVSVQARDPRGNAVSAPIGVFYFAGD